LAAAFCIACVAAQEVARLTFEVASIKPSQSTQRGRSINPSPAGQMKTDNAPVKMLNAAAYGVSDYQILKAPAWTESDGYDIVAKSATGAEPNPDAWMTEAGQKRYRERLQSLLADRFALQAHFETRESSILELVAAKGGPKLKPSEKILQVSWGDTFVTCNKCTLERFAAGVLTQHVGRSVVDRTSVTGEYDIQVNFVPDPSPGKPDDPTPTGPSFVAALTEQLGLRLEPAKGPVQFLVIDRVERPTEN
jgi:uncharacterized protein (TIGR03435 family)